MKKSYKAVLVPQSKNPLENSTALSKEFRFLLGKLAQQHLTELAKRNDMSMSKDVPPDVRNQLSAVWDELALLRSQVSTPASPAYHDGHKPAAPPMVHAPPPPPEAMHPQMETSVSVDENHSSVPGIVDQDSDEEEKGNVSPKRTNKTMMLEKEEEEEKRRASMTSQQTLDFEEEEDKSFYMKMRGILSSVKFDLFIGGLIMINVMFMFLQCQYDGMRIGYSLQPTGDVYTDFEFYMWFPDPVENVLPYVAELLKYIDLGFTITFTIDVSLKIIFVGLAFWFEHGSPQVLNILDFTVVCLGLYAIIAPDFDNPSYMRMLRLAKIARMARAVKNSPAVQSLQMLLKCITSSVHTLGWSLCVVVVMQSIMGLTISSMVQGLLEDKSAQLSYEVKKKIFYYYGTFTKTMFTMFEVLFASWIPASRALIDNVSEAYSVIFVVYRCIIGFAVLSVVRAVFVQSTMKVAQQDQELLIAQKQRANEAMQKNLKKLFREIDTSGDGALSHEELMEVIGNPKMKLWMSALEIDTHDLEALFKLLDDGDGEISIDEFLGGITRFKGPAKAIDLASVLITTNKMNEKLDLMDRKLKKMKKH
mmetsp:Transcript_98814/g.175994  ORF Transcript_98814/g.175994 Transcript_98814/m.175994 type:complete len:590 (-) Transcript_98814:120-1889(-)